MVKAHRISYPSSAGLRKGWNQRMSTYLVEDGSFFQGAECAVSHIIMRGQEWFGTAIPDTRISLTAERPLTIFSYNGFNPEVPDGIDRQTYPIPAVYTLRSEHQILTGYKNNGYEKDNSFNYNNRFYNGNAGCAGVS
jgi:hypothetical protein